MTANCDPGGPADAGLIRELQVSFPLDISLTLSVHRRGGGDPAYRVDAAGAVWRTSLTPDGPGTLRISITSRHAVVTGRAWGPGAGWLLDALPAQLGFHDDRSGFIARHPVVSQLALRYDAMRVGRSGRVFEALVPAVLEQKVVGREAHRAWRYPAPQVRRGGAGARSGRDEDVPAARDLGAHPVMGVA